MSDYQAFRKRVHQRVCVSARSCTCPPNFGVEVVTEARELAAWIHARHAHPGTPDACASSHDVICKAVHPR